MALVKDSVIYLAGELISKSIPFMLLPYLSRKLGVEGYGELSYYQTYLALFAIIIGLSQEGAIARYFYFYGKRSLDLVLTSGYSYAIFTGMLMLLGCWYFKSEIMAYLVIAAVFQVLLTTQLSVRQCQKQAIPYTVIQLLSAGISTLITIVLLEYYQTDLVEKRIIAILTGNLSVFLIAYLLYSRKINRKKYFKISQYRTALLYILGFGLPLILHHASLFLKGQLDRIFIYHQFSEADLGVYAMGAQIAAILMVAIQAINKALIPYLFEALKKQRITVKNIHKWTLFSLFIVPIPALIMIFIPESIVMWLLGEQFIGTKYYIVLFLISTMLAVPYLILVNYLFYYGKNKLISICSVLSTIFYLIALTLLITTKISYVPFAGIIGAVAILPILWWMTSKISKNI